MVCNCNNKLVLIPIIWPNTLVIGLTLATNISFRDVHNLLKKIKHSTINHNHVFLLRHDYD